MFCKIFISILLVLFAHPAWANNVCADMQTTAQMNICAAQELKEVEKQQNIAYKKLMSILDATGKAKLIKAEKAWLSFRKQECLFQADVARGGSMWSQIHLMCFSSLTKNRTVQLLDEYTERKNY